jgi:hypothetical protein
MRPRRLIRWTGLGLTVLLTLVGPAAAWAQRPASHLPTGLGLSDLLGGTPMADITPANPGARTYGPVSETVHVISASEFEASLNTTAWLNTSVGAPHIGVYRVISGASGIFWAPIRLPAGALITRIELDGFDDDPAGQINSVVRRYPSPGSTTPSLDLAAVATGNPATPGSAIFPYTIPGGVTAADLTIDNVNHYYVVGISLNAAALGFSNVRVYYTLQSSPAPGTATFGDVPTSHPFFQFVEALVASGITAGCGGGNYCPDDPLTRGQMAVFLSKALGLHFAP